DGEPGLPPRQFNPARDAQVIRPRRVLVEGSQLLLERVESLWEGEGAPIARLAERPQGLQAAADPGEDRPGVGQVDADVAPIAFVVHDQRSLAPTASGLRRRR